MTNMYAVLALLPEAAKPYAKAVVAILGAALAVAAQLLPFLSPEVQDAISGVVLLLNALGVYATPNKDQTDDGYDYSIEDGDL